MQRLPPGACELGEACRSTTRVWTAGHTAQELVRVGGVIPAGPALLAPACPALFTSVHGRTGIEDGEDRGGAAGVGALGMNILRSHTVHLCQGVVPEAERLAVRPGYSVGLVHGAYCLSFHTSLG